MARRVHCHFIGVYLMSAPAPLSCRSAGAPRHHGQPSCKFSVPSKHRHTLVNYNIPTAPLGRAWLAWKLDTSDGCVRVAYAECEKMYSNSSPLMSLPLPRNHRLTVNGPSVPSRVARVIRERQLLSC